MVVSSARMAITGHCTSIVHRSLPVSSRTTVSLATLLVLIMAFILPASIAFAQSTNMPEELRAVKITNVASDVLFFG